MLPPYMNASGLITKIFAKIAEAQQPERFTLDFLKTRLGYDSGSARPFIPYLKRLGMLASDGTPTPLYARFRNPSERGAAAAEAMRIGYKDVFERNEYAYDLTKDKLKHLIVEMTGLQANDPMISAVLASFLAMRSFADFGAPAKQQGNAVQPSLQPLQTETTLRPPRAPAQHDQPGFNLSYTINLNLPETTDAEVFNAIFRSLRENLLRA